MKIILPICAVLFFQMPSTQAEDEIAPGVTPLSQEEIGELLQSMQPENKMEMSLARRGLISDQITLRAYSARYIAYHGTWDDVPYLIDALSDDSMHVGVNYVYAGMATTRYWANVALIAICKVDFGYQWDAPVESRKKSIDSWKQRWELHQRTKNGLTAAPDRGGSVAAPEPSQTPTHPQEDFSGGQATSLADKFLAQQGLAWGKPVEARPHELNGNVVQYTLYYETPAAEDVRLGKRGLIVTKEGQVGGTERR